MRKYCYLTLCVLLAAAVGPERADAQIGRIIKKKAAEVAKDAAKNATQDSAKAAPTRPADATPAASSGATPGGAASQGKADPKVWENYDFVPGNKVLFYTDFSEDRVGNFARGLKYVGGPVEVVERDGVKMLRSTARSTMLIPVGRVLPERFTLEFDILTMNPNINDQLVFEGGRERNRGEQSAEIDWSPKGTFILGGGQNQATSPVAIPEAVQSQLIGAITSIRVLMDSGYFKMFTNERRMYNNPDLPFRRDSVIRVEVHGSEDEPVFVTAIRLAESETDVLYDALASKGRWATQGILFATGKAELRPESRPVLVEIATTLKKYGDLTILIEGHTDNVGSAPSNLALSEARAAAVRAALVADFEIDGGRISTQGFGDTKPALPNTTAAGRAQNRRVEIVKQ